MKFIFLQRITLKRIKLIEIDLNRLRFNLQSEGKDKIILIQTDQTEITLKLCSIFFDLLDQVFDSTRFIGDLKNLGDGFEKFGH